MRTTWLYFNWFCFFITPYRKPTPSLRLMIARALTRSVLIVLAFAFSWHVSIKVSLWMGTFINLN